MLLMLILYTYKKVFKRTYSLEPLEVFKKFVFKFKYVLPFLLLSYTNFNDSTTESEKITFNILNKNSKIGYMDVQKTFTNKTTTYNVDSEVNTKVVFNFYAVGREKSIYKEDTLIYSSVYRKLNNKVKLNQELSFQDGKYILDENEKIETLDFDIISRNLVTLFFNEPVGINEVYSDRYKQMVKLTSMGNGVYKLTLPNKDTTVYHYKYGKIAMIDVEGSFFKIKLIPKI